MMPRQLSFLGDVNPRTQTPIKATASIILLVCILALGFSIEALAETTSLIILIIACMVNGALLRMKLNPRSDHDAVHAGLTVPIWVPTFGLIVSLSFAVMVFIDLVRPLSE